MYPPHPSIKSQLLVCGAMSTTNFLVSAGTLNITFQPNTRRINFAIFCFIKFSFGNFRMQSNVKYIVSRNRAQIFG